MSAALDLAETTATERLENSRALLRQAMQGKTKKTSSGGTRRPAPAWLADLKSIPVITVLVEAVSSWWMQHPLRVASQLAAETTLAVVQPLARRNPLGLALGALALGALLAWTRPWRWVLKPALFAGLTSQLLSRGIANLPLKSWLAALGAATSQPPPAQTAEASSRTQGQYVAAHLV
ncbi:hypothetical protein os1_07800 [Comamonadaceae bacterium OS-1]|nr:hypothetical protein os1_07800 [Comamonadaceae bacterium OS-1]